MLDAADLVKVVFSGLSALVIEDVIEVDGVIEVLAKTRGGEVACPACGTLSSRVHGFHDRAVADVPVDGRRVLVRVWARRMRCSEPVCARATFREQVPGLIERYQRRTNRLTAQVQATSRELAGRASARLLPKLGVECSRDTSLRALMRIPIPSAPVPEVLGIDDFALRRRRTYATIVIDAATGRRIEVLPGRTSKIVAEWLHDHAGVRAVCRDGSAAYAEAVRTAAPDAVQVADRWHLWHGLAEAVQKTVAAHSACWAPRLGESGTNGGLSAGKSAVTTLQRWHQVHELLDAGVGLLDCARRLGLSLNTIKRYARASEPDQIRRAPQYRATLVDPYRDYLRTRREHEPGAPIQQLLREIRERGYQGSSNLLVRYLNQGRADHARPLLSPRRVSGIMLTRPEMLRSDDVDILENIVAACPEMAATSDLVRGFAALLAPATGNDRQLTGWISSAQAADLPHVHSFVRGLEKDRNAVNAGLTLEHHNGRTEGVNTKTKLIKRQMYGRAGFDLLRHRILLG